MKRKQRWELARVEARRMYRATLLLHGYDPQAAYHELDKEFEAARVAAGKAYQQALRFTFKQLGDDDGRTKAARGDGTRIEALAVVEEDGVRRGEGAVEHPDANRRG